MCLKKVPSSSHDLLCYLMVKIQDLEIFCIFLHPLFKFIPDCDQHVLSPWNRKYDFIFRALLSEISLATPWSSNVLSFLFFLGERLKSPLKIMPGGYFSLIPFRETWKHMALEAQRVLMKQSAAVLLCRLHPEQASKRASVHTQPGSAFWAESSSAKTQNPYQGIVSQVREWGRSTFEGRKLLERLRQLTSVSGQTNQSCKLVGTAEQIFLCSLVPAHGVGSGR